MKTEVVWKAVVDNDRYEVSNDGRLRIVKPHNNFLLPYTELRVFTDHHGYRCCVMYKDKKCLGFRMHRLMMAAFVGPCPEGYEVRHLDGNRENNVLSNLAYGTRSDNMQDAIRHGTFTQKGVETHTPEAKEKIRQASVKMWQAREGEARKITRKSK